jgi:hypothetical protein
VDICGTGRSAILAQGPTISKTGCILELEGSEMPSIVNTFMNFVSSINDRIGRLAKSSQDPSEFKVGYGGCKQF